MLHDTDELRSLFIYVKGNGSTLYHGDKCTEYVLLISIMLCNDTTRVICMCLYSNVLHLLFEKLWPNMETHLSNIEERDELPCLCPLHYRDEHRDRH